MLPVLLSQEYHAPGMADYMLSAWDGVAGMLSDGGATVEVVSLPHTQYSISCYSVLCACEVASNMARYDGIEYGEYWGERIEVINLWYTSHTYHNWEILAQSWPTREFV